MLIRKAMRVAKVLGWLALVSVVALALLLVTLAIDHRQSTALPEPSGAYRVGRVTDVWTDETRDNPYAPVAGTKQQLSVWIWYPAATTPAARKAEYVPQPLRRALENHEGFLLAK